MMSVHHPILHLKKCLKNTRVAKVYHSFHLLQSNVLYCTRFNFSISLSTWHHGKPLISFDVQCVTQSSYMVYNFTDNLCSNHSGTVD